MATKARQTNKTPKSHQLTRVGLREVAVVSRVEGLELPRGLKADFQRFDSMGASDAERRAALIEKYGKRKA